MRKLLIGASALLLAGAAGAQVLGAGAGGAVGGLGAGVSGDVVGAVGAPTVGDAARGAANTTGGVARAAADAVPDGTGQGNSGKRVRVASGASIRVGEGTRCYYDDYDFDPVYRDGYYYCERTGPAVAARIRAGR